MNPQFPQQTREQKEWQARRNAEHAAMRRCQCNLFQFWRICRQRSCQRARGCKGDSVACLDRGWRLLPEDIKVWYRAAAVALSAGHTAQEAHDAGVAEMARFLESQKPQQT
jgi:hypothetical protein